MQRPIQLSSWPTHSNFVRRRVRTLAGCVTKPPDDWVFAKARRGICSQHDQGLAESLQAWPGAREPRMVAIHDSEMIRHKCCRQPEGTDVLRDHDPALRNRSLEHALIIDSAETGPGALLMRPRQPRR